MPFYDYRCPNGHKFEKPSLIKDRRKPKVCPQCKELGKLIISATHFYFKSKPGQNIIDRSPMKDYKG